jgi:hypothetical protein
MNWERGSMIYDMGADVGKTAGLSLNERWVCSSSESELESDEIGSGGWLSRL